MFIKVIAMSLESPALVTFDQIKESFEPIRKKFFARRPNLGDFVGSYSEREVIDDEGFVDLKKRSEVEGREEDIYAEDCLMELIDSKELFERDSVFVCPGSEFDDRKNGADLVVTFYEENGTTFHFSIDVKAGLTDQSENVEKSLFTVFEKLIGGRLPSVKYHHYPNSAEGKYFIKEKKELSLPNLVVWIEPALIKQYMLIMSKAKAERSEEEERAMRLLKKETYRHLDSICEKCLERIRKKIEENDRTKLPGLQTALRDYEKLRRKIQNYQNEYQEAARSGKRKLVRDIGKQ